MVHHYTYTFQNSEFSNPERFQSFSLQKLARSGALARSSQEKLVIGLLELSYACVFRHNSVFCWKICNENNEISRFLDYNLQRPTCTIPQFGHVAYRVPVPVPCTRTVCVPRNIVQTGKQPLHDHCIEIKFVEVEHGCKHEDKFVVVILF